MQTEINLPFITADASGPKYLTMKISRAKLEQLVEDLIQKTVEPCKKALQDAGLKAGDINEVILVGGMTRMPKVVETVKQFFERNPTRASIRTRSWRSVRRSRARSWPARSRTSCCST